jgi:hypothetical protein
MDNTHNKIHNNINMMKSNLKNIFMKIGNQEKINAKIKIIYSLY